MVLQVHDGPDEVFLVLHLWELDIVRETSIDVTDRHIFESGRLNQLFELVKVSDEGRHAEDDGNWRLSIIEQGLAGWLDVVVLPRQWEHELLQGLRYVELEGVGAGDQDQGSVEDERLPAVDDCSDVQDVE